MAEHRIVIATATVKGPANRPSPRDNWNPPAGPEFDAHDAEDGSTSSLLIVAAAVSLLIAATLVATNVFMMQWLS